MSSIGGDESASIEVQTGSEKPLTDTERALLQRLLSDPFSYPQQFKTWLVSYLEGSDLLLARSSVQGLSTLLGSGGGQGVFGLLPAGIIFPYGGAVAPTGALLCNGAPYSRVGYKRLFDVIGTAFGTGDGTTTFNVPDLRRRVPFGTGAGRGIGGNDGRSEGGRDIKHHHHVGGTVSVSVSVTGGTGGAGSHDHGIPGFTDNMLNAADAGALRLSSSGGDALKTVSNPGNHTHSVSASGGGSGSYSDDTTGGADQDQPAFLVVGYIVNY